MADVSDRDRRPPASTTTIKPDARSLARARRPAPVLTLTVLAHPRPELVGAIAAVHGSQKVSRLEPTFSAIDPEHSDVLGDPNLSRSPLIIDDLGEQVRIDASDIATVVELDGQKLEAATTVSTDRPVVIELAHRIALLVGRRLPRTRRGQAGQGLRGCSHEYERILAEIERVADTDVGVLLLGETGVGKERVARSLHLASPRANAPFVAVNMAALPPNLAASQLFGHAKGAFSGADRAHRGFFEQADGGTLFLDEIGDAPAAVQPMLLRVLEDSLVQPMGSSTSRKVDVRVIAATDADLIGDVEAGEFRAPLLHRLSGYQISIPPLRQRREDIALLSTHFLAEELASLGEGERLRTEDAARSPWLGTGIVRMLVCHHWPGNVRELRNVVRRLALLGRGNPEVTVDSSLASQLSPPAPAGDPADHGEAPARTGGSASISDAELVAALEAHDYQPGKTAKSLGIARGTFYQLMARCPRLRGAKELTADEIDEALAAAGGRVTAAARALKVSTRALQLRMRDLGLS